MQVLRRYVFAAHYSRPKLPKTWDTRLSIVVAGLHDVYPMGVVRRISNFENPDRQPRFDEFVVGEENVPFFQERYGVHNGMLLPEEVAEMSDGLIRLHAQPDGLNLAARLMIRMQRRVANAPILRSVRTPCWYGFLRRPTWRL